MNRDEMDARLALPWALPRGRARVKRNPGASPALMRLGEIEVGAAAVGLGEAEDPSPVSESILRRLRSHNLARLCRGT